MKPSYEAIGQFYDDLWGKRSPAWGDARVRLLEPVLSQAKTVCELGCGTGNSAIELARRGLKVFARDFSSAMCRVTKAKARALDLAIDVRQADMRTFRLPIPVDLVTSEWGVISHLPRRSALAQVFRAVARALRPGGHFYFDLHQRHIYETLWAHTQAASGTASRGKEMFMVQRGGYDSRASKGWTEITVFVKHQGRLWERHGERIEVVHWPHGELVRQLRAAGFRLLEVADFPDLDFPPSPRRVREGLRTMYLAQKSFGLR